MFKKLDIWLVIAMIGLLMFGSFNILGIRPDLFSTHLIFIVLSLCCFFVIYKVPIQFIIDNIRLVYIVFILLFIITMLFGEEIRGSRRWIDLYVFSFQTSEIFKPFFILFIANYLTKTKEITLRRITSVIFLSIIPILFILKQPDLGNVILYSTTLMSILFFAGGSYKLFFWSFVGFLFTSPLLWHGLKNYQKERIIGFINPNIDPLGLTYNIQQAVITVGSGGIFGRGLGLGTQSRFQFLPEYHTDFAFASLVEQFGLVGGTVVLLLFALLIYRLVVRVFRKKKEQSVLLYLIGSVVLLSVSGFVNIGMNLGILPVTGITMPFISYGGSSLVSSVILIAIAVKL